MFCLNSRIVCKLCALARARPLPGVMRRSSTYARTSRNLNVGLPQTNYKFSRSDVASAISPGNFAPVYNARRPPPVPFSSIASSARVPTFFLTYLIPSRIAASAHRSRTSARDTTDRRARIITAIPRKMRREVPPRFSRARSRASTKLRERA